jgi:hypothetical protein
MELRMLSRTGLFAEVLMLGFLVTSIASASAITTVDIHEIPGGAAGSGNGTLDLRLGTFSGSEVDNAGGGFDGDNANNTLSQGGGDLSFDESYVTTAGELQDYYTLNFGTTLPGEIELVLFLDLNETGGGATTNTLRVLDIVLNPATIQGNPNAAGDVTGAEQAAINQIFTPGSTIAWLDPQPAVNLPINSQGAGFADWAISTGIDPYTLAASDVLLFNFSMDLLNNGAEEIFLSGVFSGTDVGLLPIPEPSTALLLAAGLGVLAMKRRPSKTVER